MKPTTSHRRRIRNFTRTTCALLGGVLAGWVGWAQDEEPVAAAAEEETDVALEETDAEATDEIVEEEPLNLVNWVEFGAGGTFVDGSRAEYQRRRQTPEVFGGVTDFHYERELGKGWTLGLDGRGLFDDQDYAVDLDLTRLDRGYVRTGYHQFRTWYNGAGGYLPLDGSWYELYDTELYTDRGEFWFEGGLTLPDLPEFAVTYRHQFRDGTKNSTSWGPVGVTGLPPGADQRGIVPGFLGLDEVRDIFTADVKHRFGETSIDLGIRYEAGKIDDTRNMRWSPGQPGDAHVTQRDTVDDDLFNVHSVVESRLSEKAVLTVGYAYTDLNTDHSGYRVYGVAYDPDLGQRLPNPSTYGNLAGGSLSSQHTGSVNVLLTLAEKLLLIPSVRIEQQDLSSQSFYNQPADRLSPAYGANSDRGFLELSENLELRYTGLANWVLYARGNWMQGSGDLQEDWNNLTTGSNVIRRDTDDTRSTQKYSAGANWYPWRAVSFSGQYYHKIRDNDYDHRLDSTSNSASSPLRYPAFLNAQHFDTDDVNFRVTVRPRSNLSLMGRYDFQLTTIESRPDQLANLQTSDTTSHVVSGAVSWVPFSRVYLMANVSYVWDRTDTRADDFTATVADARNDYWTTTFGIGYALDEKTDLQAQYVHYLADNYVDDSSVTVPYGAGFQEHGVTVGLTRQLNARTRLGLNYGYFNNSDEMSGNHLDYEAHLVYSTLQYRF
ncbi:MAG: hypothetical protein H7A45_19400 [Verrucomicrobiales bacterium]|nr:hypothetical protein [Verrucomicrobiales bacterium]